jgi:serine/threonine protein kinase
MSLSNSKNKGVARGPDLQQVKAKYNKGQSWFVGIGINDYDHCDKLNNAHNDVKAFIKLFQSRYHFDQFITLYDKEATRAGILTFFQKFDPKPDDKVLIYYAGHGHMDNKRGGYWIPKDGNPLELHTLVKSATIRDEMANISARHVLLISDSCFSGDLLIKNARNNRVPPSIARMESRKSRWVFTSGRQQEIVSDGLPGSNSPFASTLLKILAENTESALNIVRIADEARRLISFNHVQEPQIKPLFQAQHDDGEYVFWLRQPVVPAPSVPGTPTPPQPGSKALPGIHNYSDFKKRYVFDSDEPLKEGGQSYVYKAKDLKNGNIVAIKRAQKPEKKYEKYSVYQEFKRAMKIPPHFNLAKYYEVYRMETSLGIFDFGVMEFIGPDSKNLDDFMVTFPSEKKIKQVLIGILKGLRHLHSNKTIHRDLKPGNVLIADAYKNPTPKIIDFGVSMSLEDTKIAASHLIGTIEYMAPEQINPRKGQKLKYNADLWAFGVITYRMLRSNMPFGALEAGNERTEIQNRVMDAKIPDDIHEILSPYREIIQKCLIKDPAKRFQSADEILDILEGRAADATELAKPTELVHKIASADTIGNTHFLLLAPFWKRNGLIIALSASILILLTAIAYYSWTGKTQDGLEDKNTQLISDPAEEAPVVEAIAVLNCPDIDFGQEPWPSYSVLYCKNNMVIVSEDGNMGIFLKNGKMFYTPGWATSFQPFTDDYIIFRKALNQKYGILSTEKFRDPILEFEYDQASTTTCPGYVVLTKGDEIIYFNANGEISTSGNCE